jgi:hypothetical protein
VRGANTVNSPVVATKTTREYVLGRDIKRGVREMGSRARGGYDSKSVIQFAPAAKNAAPDNVDQLDKAGQTILGLLH